MKIIYPGICLSSFRARFQSFAALAFAGLLAAWSAGAADAPASSAPAKPAAARVSTSAGETRVTLLQAGSAPRKALRLHVKAGDKRTSTMTIKMGMTMQAGTMDPNTVKMPTMKMTMDSTVRGLSPQGEIAYDMVMSDVTVAEDPNIMPQVVETMKTTMGGLKGLSLAGKMSNRGINQSTEMKMPDDANPQARQAMEQMREAFSNSGVALPEEPIGLGAKWEVKQKVKSQGMTLDQTTIYDLVSSEGDRFTTKCTLTQTAANQQIENPSMPGLKMNLVKFSTKGNGQVTSNLGQLMPVQSVLDMHNDTAMTMDTEQKSEMSVKMDVNVVLETK